jgi:integrase
MATFTIWLDKRNPKNKKDEYNLTIRACISRDVIYLNILKLTEKQYRQVFVRNLMDKKSIEYRETFNSYLTKCERIFSELKPFNRKRFKELFFEKDKEIPSTLLLKELFQYYIDNYENIKYRSRKHYQMTINVLESYRPGLTVEDITPEFLNRFEKDKKIEGYKQSSIDSLNRNIRRIINYFTYEKKVIPRTYEYPFGKGGYSIKSFFPRKLVMKNEEILKVAELTNFDNPAQEYARDIWLFLFRCNGINFVDLLRMKWAFRQGEYLIFTRKKTESTRKNNIKEITAPIIPKLQLLMDKIGDKESPFILGKLQEDYTEQMFENKLHKLRQPINQNLQIIGEKLNLSVPLKLETARDCYASYLVRTGKTVKEISEMLGHSNVIVTEHYLASLDIEKTLIINEDLP